MSDTNTIMGWVLGAGIVALGGGILFGEVMHTEAPETPGFAIESAESDDGGAVAEVPIATLLASADAANGEAIFAKCKTCHTLGAGGADGVGPNINAALGAKIASGSFPYSSALKEIGGSWNFDNMDAWLKSPKKFAAGNKMSFPGLSKGEDRADLLLYLNSQGSNLPLPEAPALTADEAAEDQVIDEAAEEEAAEG